MNEDYTLEYLLEKFTEHSITFEEKFKLDLDRVKKGEIDDSYCNEKNCFNFPQALCTIIQEIQSLK